jgi:hypothetical protein
VGNGMPFALHVGDSLIVKGQGVLEMSGSATTTTLDVAGNALFNGASTAGLLTGGTLKLRGNLFQGATASVTSFAPSGANVTEFASTGNQTVSFTTPGTGAGGSHFATLRLTDPDTTKGLVLATPMFVDDTLTLSVGPSSSAMIFGGGNLVTAAGLYVPNLSNQHLVFSNAPLRFVDGSAATTLDGLTFRNFGSSVAFDDARSDAITLNGARWEGTPSGGNFLVKSGTGATVTLNSPYPAGTAWTSGVYYKVTGSGSVIIN